jgi:ubiquinone/menaquinone biosynthesis C-methylase UbiE
MTCLAGFLVAAGLLALAAVVYWQMIIAEGAYLGPRVVAWTYDLVARRYDAIKRFQPRDESWFVAGPVLRGLLEVERPLLLDVATGTGRVPLALLRSHFRGQIVGLDFSRGMLRQARAKLQDYGDRVVLIWQDASHLPFADGTFDAVTCLESLEFMPQPPEALAEMVRVLAPGGLLYLTNRVGVEARLLPGRAIPRPQFEGLLSTFPLRDIEIRPWQVNYDLAVASKEGQGSHRGQGEAEAMALIRCTRCGGELQPGVASLSCPGCQRRYPIRERIVHLAGFEERSAA